MYIPKMEQVWRAPAFSSQCARLRLEKVADFAQHFCLAEPIGKKNVRLARGFLNLGDRRIEVWYKQYDYPAASWRYVWRQSRARREFESYAAMEKIGVQCAAPVACGEQRDRFGRLIRAFIITVAIPEAMPLAQFIKTHCDDRADSRGLRQMLLRDLAQMTRKAHDGGFIHSDLWVRNVLVNWEKPGQPAVWWIDSPRGAVWRLLTRFGKVLDLASLDKGAAELCSRAERMRFLREYAEPNSNGATKKLAKKVIQYRFHKDRKALDESVQVQGVSLGESGSGRV
jgi:tRNA A-37 threonylcarbamoyl transferase component Bud32